MLATISPSGALLRPSGSRPVPTGLAVMQLTSILTRSDRTTADCARWRTFIEGLRHLQVAAALEVRAAEIEHYVDVVEGVQGIVPVVDGGSGGPQRRPAVIGERAVEVAAEIASSALLLAAAAIAASSSAASGLTVVTGGGSVTGGAGSSGVASNRTGVGAVTGSAVDIIGATEGAIGAIAAVLHTVAGPAGPLVAVLAALRKLRLDVARDPQTARNIAFLTILLAARQIDGLLAQAPRLAGTPTRKREEDEAARLAENEARNRAVLAALLKAIAALRYLHGVLSPV